MNINFFITSLGGGGAERVICNLANYLVSRQHRVSITVLRGDDDTYKLDKNVARENLQPRYYREEKSRFYRLKEVTAIARFLKRRPKESLTVAFLELPIAYSLVFRKLCKSKLVICERNNPLFYSLGYRKLFEMLVHRADGCTCQTKSIMEWYEPKLKNTTKRLVIPNALNEDILSSPIPETREKVIMSMGRLEPQKNHKMLIEAFAQIANEFQDYKLVIYGKGPLENELNEYVASFGLSERVCLPGFTNNVVAAYSEAKLFVLTSEHEGMPNVLAEAMAMGLPCISTDCGGGGARELIQNEVNGILIERNDLKGLVIAMRLLLNNSELSTSISSQALRLRDKLTPIAIHREWESFFEMVYS